MITLRVMRAANLAEEAKPSACVQVKHTEVLKFFTRHMVGSPTAASSIMLLKESLRGLFKIDTTNALRLMRLVCQANAHIAARGLQHQVVRASVKPTPREDPDPAAAKIGSFCDSDPDAVHVLQAGGAVSATDAYHEDDADDADTESGHAGAASDGEHEEGQLDSPLPHMHLDEATHADVPDTIGREQMTLVTGSQYQATLAVALLSAGEAGLMHKHVVDLRMDQAESMQASDQAAAVQQKQPNSDTSLAACVQSQKENLDLERECLENHVQQALQPTLAVVVTLCRSKALLRTNKTLRASALLALMKLMCSYKGICEDTIFLRLLFTCLSPCHRCERFMCHLRFC